jgi:hypothetical protein
MFSKLTKSRQKSQAVSFVKNAAREEYMSKLKLKFAVAALCGGLTATAASAMPVAPVPVPSVAKIEQVRWVCGRYGRCWWRPNYYYGYPGYYGYGGYGYGYPYAGYYGYPYRRYSWGRRYWW